MIQLKNQLIILIQSKINQKGQVFHLIFNKELGNETDDSIHQLKL